MRTINDFIREIERIERTPENFIALLRQLGTHAAVPSPDAARSEVQDKPSQFVVNVSDEECSSSSLLNDQASAGIIEFLEELKHSPWDQRSWDQGPEVKGVGQDSLSLLSDQNQEVVVNFLEELKQLDMDQQRGEERDSSLALPDVALRDFSSPLVDAQGGAMGGTPPNKARLGKPLEKGKGPWKGCSPMS